MCFRISLNQEFDLKIKKKISNKSGTFSQFDLLQP